MKNFYLIAIFIAYCLSISFTKAQDLVWDYTVTDGNMTIALVEGSVILDGVELEADPLCLVGVFYSDDNGDLTCGGYTDLSVFNAAIAAWGNDGSSGVTDGFNAGEEMNFYMHMDGVDYAASSITWAVGSNSYATNGTNVISTIEFSSAQIELDPCTCIDGTVGTQSGGFCILPNSYCTDPLSDNYCNVEGLDVIANQVPYAEEDCSYGDVAGCTCPNADNYDSQAGSDDGSCVMEEGCSDPLANNYSLTGCSNVTIANEYCELPGCTCPSALNYDESATSDDLSCVSVVSICTDPAATNFNEGCANTIEYAASSCEYEEEGCELDNIEWDFTVTDANMTIQVAAEVVLINGAEPPCGSLLGGFYTNDSGQLVCGGYQTWCDDFSNNQLAVPLMASESGYDNGFQTGEEITWLLYIGSQTFSANDIVMTNGGPFSETFVSNGFGQLTTANFECEVTGVLGCTDPTAYNYDSSATIDDESCYNVDFTVINTDCNATILIQDEDINALNISLNGESIPVGSTIGVFYENENGELACAGSSEWTGTATTIPAMGAEAGYDNGFQNGEEFTTFFLLIGEQIIPMDDNGAEMSTIGWQNTYSCNGFANLVSVNFEGEYDLTYGCTDNTACNYDSSAILDDESCDYGQTWYQDSDGDGLGNPDISIESCNEVTGFVDNNDDPCPDTENNPNNVTIWYLDSDGDGLGEDQIIEFGCEYIGSDDFPLADNNDDPCPYNPINEDIDGDNITDCADDCVGQYDALGICEGDCGADQDSDGICDDVDDCVGTYDTCGVCDGPGEIYECGCSNIPEGNCDCNGNQLDAIDVCGGDCTEDDNNNGLCDVDEIVGCTDSAACNFTGATFDDGSCEYLDALDICGGDCLEDLDLDGVCDNIDDCIGEFDAINVCDGDCTEDNNNNGLCDVDEVVGCIDSAACNFTGATFDDGTCEYLDALDICGGDCLEDLDGDNVCDADEIEGCQDSLACNYNPEATDQCNIVNEILFTTTQTFNAPWSIEWEVEPNTSYLLVVSGLWGIANGEACYDAAFNTCNNDEVTGCDSDSRWIYADDSCIRPDDDILNPENIYEYTLFSDGSINISFEEYYGPSYEDNSGELNFTLFAIDNCCTYALEGESCAGCTDPTACNYSAGSTVDDGSCLTIYGCNDFEACNYDPTAECDDGSCAYELGCGCGEPAAEEGYDCNNNCLNDTDNDGVCDEFEIVGCEDESACNYEPTATDSGECIYTVEFYDCDNICLNDIDNDGVCDELDLGCTDEIACNYDDGVTGDDGSCIYVIEFYDCDDNCLADTDDDNVCDELEISGCTDNTACSYNEQATDDCEDVDNDGILDCCTYLEESCDTCEGGIVIDNDIDNDGVCDDDEIPGCTDPTACNFDPDLGCTDDDGSCFYSQITVDIVTQDASCEAVCDGVIELIINNAQPPYNVEYNLVDEDGNIETVITAGNLTTSCAGNYAVLVSDAYNCESEMMMIIVGAEEPDSDGDGICDNDETEGCTDTSACNYNSSVTEDDGSCEYCSSDLGDIDSNGFDDCELINNQAIENGNTPIYDCDGCINDIDFDGVCDELELIGCTDNNACNYNNQASDSCDDLNNDGVLDCCEYPIYYYWDCDGNCLNDTDEDGVCDEIEITGCGDTSACNYESAATEETDCIYPIEFYDCDGNCINDGDNDAVCDELEIEGCQDGTACNYNPEATDPCLDCCAFIDGDGDGYPNFISYIETTIDIICPGDDNGGFVMYTNGGLSPYTLTVDGQEISSEDGIFSVSELSGGSYNVSVIDSNGCQTIQAVDIQEPNPIDITIEYLNYVSCDGDGDGSLTNSIQGGTPPYEFEWVDAGGTVLSTDQDIFNLDAGAYAVNVIDANNCTSTAAFIVGDPNPLDISITYYDVTCYGGNDGSATLFITGGSSPYTEIYTDSDDQIANPNALSAGDYVITVTDNNGCIFIDEVTIDEPSLLEFEITSTDTEMCEDDDDIIITAIPNNFTSYILSNEFGVITESTYNSLSVNESGEYFVTAVSDEGCEVISNTIAIEVFENPIIDINGQTDVIAGNTYTYYVTDSGWEYGQWIVEPSYAGEIVGDDDENNIQITWILEAPGPAQVYLTQVDENGCASTGFIDIMVEWETGLADLAEELDFVVYPNPFVDETTIEINNPNKTNYSLYLYDAKGSIVKSFINYTDNTIQLTGPFSKGLYYLHLTNNKVNTRKLIVVE